MDLLWRVVSSVLISGRSHEVRCAFDPASERLIIHDPTTPVERRRIVGWGKLGRIFVSPELRERQDAALNSRDIYTLRRDAGAAVHRACERIRIVSQEADSPRSVHVLWSSKVFTSGERVAVTYGPRAPFREGMTMLVKVSSAVTPWMRHLKHFFPFITEDPSLWDDPDGVAARKNLNTASHAVDTPVRDSLSAGIPSPMAVVVSPLQPPPQRRSSSAAAAAASRGPSAAAAASSWSTTADQQQQQQQLADPCTVCARRLPPSLVVFTEQCAHTVCVECATACARHYAEVPSAATTYGCPCPAARCPHTLLPHELRPLLSTAEYDTLEVNEMRMAVDSGISCPACRMVFDGDKIQTVRGDPLENRFKCSVCDTSFCIACGAHPFHEGKPCRDVAQKGQPTCRYCGNPAVSLEPTIVCGDPSCVDKSARACTVSKPCGHLCHGTKGESQCCSCLEPNCVMRQQLIGQNGGGGSAALVAVADHNNNNNNNNNNVVVVDVTKDDFCAICYVETLGEAPCVELACGHVFHMHCLEARLEHKWLTAAVSYRFLDCPLCGRPIAHLLLATALAPLQRAKEALESRYVERLRIEGLLDHPAITAPSSPFYNAPVSWARQNLTYFECFHCQRPYFGGVRGCVAAADDPEVENPPRDQLVCGGCALVIQQRRELEAGGGNNGNNNNNNAQPLAPCKEHGTAFLEFKCKYCCSIAVWFCWGTTHFCDLCHNPPRKTVRMECPGEELCPLQGKHPPNGTEFLLGCAVCRSKPSSADGSAAAAAAAAIAAA